jgi:hypothetical protein
MTEPDPKDLPAVALRLITTIDGLTKAIGLLMDRAEASEKKIDEAETGISATKKHVKVMWALIAVDLLLSFTLTTLFYLQFETNQKLNDTRAEVLCPLYSLIAGAYDPSTRKAGAARDAYIAGYQNISSAYSHLDCPTPPLPPRVTGAPPTIPN